MSDEVVSKLVSEARRVGAEERVVRDLMQHLPREVADRICAQWAEFSKGTLAVTEKWCIVEEDGGEVAKNIGQRVLAHGGAYGSAFFKEWT